MDNIRMGLFFAPSVTPPLSNATGSVEPEAFDLGYQKGYASGSAQLEEQLAELRRSFNCWPVPPANLRQRVSGDPDRDKFLGIGQTVYGDLKRLAAVGDKSFAEATRICDFGCGPGRVTRFLDPGEAAITGIDIDPEAVAWSQEHLGELGTFLVGPHEPPLALAEGSFDLVFAVSVFTHLPPDLADAWLGEIERLLTPDGVFIATFLHEEALHAVAPEGTEAFATKGVYYSTKYATDGLPGYYGLTFHSKVYVEERWSRLFDVIGYFPKAIAGFQDAVVCRKRLIDATPLQAEPRLTISLPHAVVRALSTIGASRRERMSEAKANGAARKTKPRAAKGASTTPPHRYRSHTCGALRRTDAGGTARLSGWVHRVRDHGGLLFIDLRDHYGLTQVVADPDSPAFKTAERVRSEWVIRIDGKVRERPDGTVNPELPTGAIEVFASEIEVLSVAKELPIPVAGEADYPEDLRLKYRFLDLRREELHKNIMLRNEIIGSIRRRMREAGFFEFQTPILTASSPEGARDFLVPSRLHPGQFYALPQAPQQFKQLIMIAGFDRYFQIAPCFRDEDARADRSPGEFYQLDVEMSFVEQEDVFEAIEPVMRGLFEEFAKGRPVNQSFPRIPYDEAIRKYGTDKPDLRNPIEMADVTEQFLGSGFRIFAGMIDKDPKVRVWAIPAPGGGSRAFCDRMNGWAQGEGQPGLAYIFFREGEAAGPVGKNIGPERASAIQTRLGLKEGDAVFFTAGNPEKFYKFAGEARSKIGRELSLIDENRFEFCWIVDFPMFEWNEEEKKVDFSHNPFSMPQGGLAALENAEKNDELLALKAFQYDIVCNGVELSSGAIRNHLPEIMLKAFAIAGYGPEVLEAKFGGMLKALSYGAPPHGGIAPGVDRIVMLLAGASNLRDVIMFPMNQQAQDLLMGAPSEVSPKQLRELHIRPAP